MAEDGTISWRELRTEATERLTAAGFESPAVDARRIVEEASGFEGAEHHLHLDEPVTKRAIAAFDQMLLRRVAGEPLQYVLGRWGFRSLDLFVDRRVLIPRPETEGVVDHVLAELDRFVASAAASAAQPVLVDLGTGSGAIALSVAAERTGVSVWATDRSEDALAVARANLSGIESRAATRVRMASGDWYEALPEELAGTVAVVASNPPYVADSDPLPAEVAEWEPDGALVSGPTGLEAVELIVALAPRWLAPGGSLVVEIGESHGPGALDLARHAGFHDVSVHPDLAGRDRTLVARFKGNSS